MDYINEICPVCKRQFGADDDIVVCPDCGTPHHRDCWNVKKACENSALHGEGFVWKPMAVKNQPAENPSVVAETKSTSEGGTFAALPKMTMVESEEDIENLLIQQIEFCNVIVLNKVDEVTKEQLNEVKAVIKSLQPTAKIIETNYAKVDVKEIMDTNNFDFEDIQTSAGWIKELEKEDEETHHNDHNHDEHHHHHHEEGEAEEYGISTFVYTSRKPLDEKKFEDFVNDRFPSSIIRCKGLVWFGNDYDMSYLFEQAGKQMQLTQTGYWLASAPKDELKEMIAQDPEILKDWDKEVGDRMVKLVFIGRKMNKEAIIKEMEDCH